MINIREFLGLGYYTSKLDEFLAEFDKKRKKLSSSQRKEKDKYSRIYALRDNPNLPEAKDKFWEKF